MVDAESKQISAGEWWARWREADYSWEALGAFDDRGAPRHPWIGWSVSADGTIVESEKATNGSRPATLQDYWRHEEAHLIEGDGRRWTRVHCPLAWSDGTPSPKASWSESERNGLLALCSSRMLAGAETAYDGRLLVGPDRRAQLQGGILFEVRWEQNARVFGRFEDVYFSGRAIFQGATFGTGAEFMNAWFEQDANFRSVFFSGVVYFTAATFAGSATFEFADFAGEAHFSDATFLDDVGFSLAVFRDSAGFSEATFHRYASFYGGRCEGPALFNGARFAYVIMAVREFRALALFDSSKFFGRLEFTSAAFHGLAAFDKIKWPSEAQHWHCAFSHVQFRGPAVFSGAGFKAFAAFAEALFHNGLSMDELPEDLAKSKFAEERASAIAAAKWDVERWIEEETQRRTDAGERRIRRSEIANAHRVRKSVRLKQLERGCRALKGAMSFGGDRLREQALYRFEVVARRAQLTTPAWEKALSYLYGWMSDYGTSMARPLMVLGIATGLFAAIYFALAIMLGIATYSLPEAWQAVDMSWENTFRPLSALSYESTIGDSLSARLISQTPPGWSFGIRALATFQSLLAIVLAFLFALAVRRRFQIHG